MNRHGHGIAAALGLLLGAGPAMLATLVPAAAGLDQLGTVLLGAILGMRAAGRRALGYAAELAGAGRSGGSAL
jgi:hypothetical protein